MKFVLLIQKLYNAINGLTPNFTVSGFAEALKSNDLLVRLLQMICAAFKGNDGISEVMTGIADDTCKEFLKFELNGDGGAGNDQEQQGKGKSKQGKVKGKGSDQPDQPGEKKGLSKGAKVVMGITIPAAVLVTAGLLAWKTGYGAKIWGKIKTLMNPDGKKRSDIKFNSQGNKPVVKN